MKKISKILLKSNIFKLLFISLIVLLRSIVLLFPAILIKYAINYSIPKFDVFSLFFLGGMVAIIPFFTNYLISLDLKISSFILDNSLSLIDRLVNRSLTTPKNDSAYLYYISKGLNEISYFFYRDIGSLLWCLATIGLGMIYILIENIIIFLVIVIIFLSVYFLLSIFYKKLIVVEDMRINKTIHLQSISQNLDDLGIKSFYNEKLNYKFIHEINKVNDEIISLSRKRNILEQLITSVIKFFNSSMVVIIFCLGSYLIGRGSIGSIVSIYQISIWMIPAMTLLIQLSIKFSSINIKVDTLEELVNVKDRKQKHKQSLLEKKDYFEIISGSYGNSKLDKNIILTKGKIYLFTGAVGIGKSSFLSNFVRQQEGYFNNIWYSQTTPIIFSDTIINNIRLNQNISDQKIIELLDIHNFPKTICDRFYEEVNFNTLSGGERQLIEFARLLIRAVEFDILIFDESFSAIDPVTFGKIWKVFINNFSDKTIIVVSHKKLESIVFDFEVKFSDYFEVRKDEKNIF
ncbi:ABC transporter ATP-binding protein [uncultured Granulicatella sp.]|uniref:ABC transporter ATP-binding protein n=1 Tax=uncultured Granulicatella sp. TaxID=316089 RepID=UPI0028D17090|nr:ABC transporter ATP-binding protein [uncultured Granulicatella sp.]